MGADDLELNIVRGLLLKLPAGYEPKDADIFVKYEFGFPKEAPQTGKTASIKGTNSPSKRDLLAFVYFFRLIKLNCGLIF